MDAESRTTLFRSQHLRHLTQRLHGEISLALPVSWQVVGCFLSGLLAAALAFICTASYARVETIVGVITLDKGVVSIMPSRPGIVTQLIVREGAEVNPGDQLLRIRAEEFLERGDTAPDRILNALDQQNQSFELQAAFLSQASSAEQSRLAEQANGLVAELDALDAQIVLQDRVTQLAERVFLHAQDVASKGYISRHDLDATEADLLAQRQHVVQLKQSRAAKASELAAVRRVTVQSAANSKAQAAGLSSSRAQVAQQIAQTISAQGYALTSPVRGTVTAMTARVGQPVSATASAMLIVPEDSQPLAELYVPSSAIGFLEVGQEVRLSIDAFPYERFGIVKGHIAAIASAAVLRTSHGGDAVPVYLVTVSLPQPWIVGFGRRQPLLAGMTLSARIVTRRQTLLEWLFEPVYSVSRR
jgi:membrane fusion protein